jgi:hypothetical protein
MRREHFAGDLFRYFEGEAEVLRRLPEEPAPEFGGRELVKGKIAAHRGKDFGVFAKAFGFEQLLRKTAARKIALAAVDLSEPAFVLPRTAADINVAGREFPQLQGQPVAIECAGFVEKRTYHACEAR